MTVQVSYPGVYIDEVPFGSSNADNNGGYQTGDFDLAAADALSSARAARMTVSSTGPSARSSA